LDTWFKGVQNGGTMGQKNRVCGPENAKKIVLSSVLLATLKKVGSIDYIIKNNDAKYGKQYWFIQPCL